MEGSQPAHGDTELVTQEQTRDARSASTPEAAATSIQASSQSSQMESMLGHRHSRLIALLARSIVGCMDNGYTNSKQPPHEQQTTDTLLFNDIQNLCEQPWVRIEEGGSTFMGLA